MAQKLPKKLFFFIEAIFRSKRERKRERERDRERERERKREREKREREREGICEMHKQISYNLYMNNGNCIDLSPFVYAKYS